MNTLVVVAIFIVSVLLAMNLYVTYLLAKSDFYEPVQKYAQCGLIWLLPVIDALACYVFVQPSLGPPSGKYVDSDTIPDEDLIEFSLSNKGHAGSHDNHD
ncbi:hypothetical protein [Undibacterium sp. TS12]|uniref:hypothetical protein n=1 Tax=Undibacterium sp. TS12 TaxID=2908202 RepID=UPI001F4D0AF5|nr:hypothetical protein [Undibacterium sp. TS12]MCH8617786.1 hypothetical protein [Undibacterium sp. TS12]